MRILIYLIVLFCIKAIFTPVAQAEISPSSHYARLPEFYTAKISPNGRWLAAVIENKGAYIVRVFDLEDMDSEQVRATGIGEAEIEWLKWANNEQILISYFTTRKEASTYYKMGTLIVMDKDMKNMKSVLRVKGRAVNGSRLKNKVTFRQFNNVVVDHLVDDPDHILMAFGTEDQFAPGVHKVSLKSGAPKKLIGGSTNTKSWMTDLDGKIRVREGRSEHTGDYSLRVRENGTKNSPWHMATHYPGLESTTDVYGFMRNPNEMIIGARNGKSTMGLYIYDLAQKKRTRKLFHHDIYDVDDIVLSADGKKVVGVSYTADSNEIEFFDAEYKSRMAIIKAKLKGFNIRYLDQTPNGKKVIFKANSPSNPSILYLYDFDKDEMQIVGYDYPEIGKTLQADVTKVKYVARDGYKVPGYITTPPKIADGAVAFKNLPFIILPHGGPYARDTASFDVLAQFFASRGYAVLQPNYRGSAGFGSAHLQAGRKNWEVMQEDVEDGVRWLIKKEYADPKRICIVGWSYGGYAALMGAIKNPELYVCTASIAGVTDPKGLVRDLKKFRFGKHTAKSFILNGFEDKGDIKENSPVKRADEIKVPVFLAHGTRDAQVIINQYRSMKRALGKRRDGVFIEFKDGDHSLMNIEHRTELYAKLDAFLSKHLGVSEAAP